MHHNYIELSDEYLEKCSLGLNLAEPIKVERKARSLQFDAYFETSFPVKHISLFDTTYIKSQMPDTSVAPGQITTKVSVLPVLRDQYIDPSKRFSIDLTERIFVSNTTYKQLP